MLSIDAINSIIYVVLTVTIVVCSLGLVIAIKFQNKQNKKYQECLKLIKEKENKTLNDQTFIEIEELKDIDINKLMIELYDTYLLFVDRLNNNDKNFENILSENLKDFYEDKIDIYNKKYYKEITNNIELINYSILECQNGQLKFRITINCFNYKQKNEQIISGNNLQRVEQVFIVNYIKTNDKWLIDAIEKVLEKNLSI